MRRINKIKNPRDKEQAKKEIYKMSQDMVRTLNANLETIQIYFPKLKDEYIRILFDISDFRDHFG